ncbi:DUF397 domain-containing protein [Nocardiopsis potens]|uniref:DUF397 domain-containing protein n=1 Tax=Nocardiopsis potens TaxID=1246458 RepID=UPI00038142EC|nr:DUF397 domain-containing protein [Nocardiopsis potens]
MPAIYQNSFHKSSYSSAKQENCVEVAEGTVTAVRDSQNRHLGHVEFSASEWRAFLDALKAGEL